MACQIIYRATVHSTDNLELLAKVNSHKNFLIGQVSILGGELDLQLNYGLLLSQVIIGTRARASARLCRDGQGALLPWSHQQLGVRPQKPLDHRCNGVRLLKQK